MIVRESLTLTEKCCFDAMSTMRYDVYRFALYAHCDCD